MSNEKEHVEGMIATTRDNITMAEMLLANNPDIYNAADLKGLLVRQKEMLKNYKNKLDQINQVGRPPIGITKKVSMTLSEEQWEWLDEKADGNRSNFLREIIQKEIEGSRK